jgi:hypothetical protein
MDSAFKQNDVKELTMTLYSLKGLSHELSQEKDSIMSSAGQISFASNQFKKYSLKFEEQLEQLNKKIQMIISQEIKSVGKVISEEASRSFVDNCNSQAEAALKKLTDMTNNCEERLNEAGKKIDFFSRWFMSVAVGGAIIGGLFVGGMFRYLPANHDQRTKEKIHAGEMLEAAWRVLDQKEKDKIFVAANLKSK